MSLAVLPDYDIPQFIVSLCLITVAVIISTTILIIECKTRRKIMVDQHLRELNTTINNKSLRFLSLIALFCCPITSIPLLIAHIPIPATCTWTILRISTIFWLLLQIFFTLYQISRLKYCFSTNNSPKYGYPNVLFIILRIYGFCIIIWSIFIIFYVGDAETDGILCFPRTTKYAGPMIGLWMVLFYLWDWTVLILYIIKLVQFQCMRDKMDIVHKKVFFILQKMVSLTIIYEIAGMVTIISGIVFDESILLTNITHSMSVIISSFILFLMIEHNNDHYVKIIYKLNKYYLCCCCKSLIKDVIKHELEEVGPLQRRDDTKGSSKNMDGISNLDTGDISSEHLKLELPMMMESELTVTNMSKHT